jgi:flavoprotein
MMFTGSKPARYFLCDNFQQKKEDFIFHAPVVQNTLVKIVITITAQRGYVQLKMDGERLS